MTDYRGTHDFPVNSVTIVNGIPPLSGKQDIIRGAVYAEPATGELFIGANTAIGGAQRLVALRDGNRWVDTNGVPAGWTRIVPGSEITLKVGGV